MRIIQSSWACNQPDLITSNAGWLAPEYNLMSWTLSCLQLKQYYSEVVLYCDSVSAKTLIDVLQLPYTDVVCNLDVLNTYHHQLWALPKIHAYSLQEKPFLHIDGDVFVFEKFEEELLKSGLIAQNVEAATDYYEKIMLSLESKLTFFPKEIIKERELKNPILAYNAGIFGGTDVLFFKEYTEKAFRFVDKNILNLSGINVTNFNIFFEQYLFYCLTKKNKKQVNVLIPEIIGDNEYKGFGDFTKVPFGKKYLHLLGAYKRNEFICKQMANRLRQDYPVYYYRIIELFKKNKTPLYKDYYFFVNTNFQEDLVSRAIKLKTKYFSNEIIKIDPIIKTNNQYQWTNIAVNNLFDKSLLKLLNRKQLQDITDFCQRINGIFKSKFSLFSLDYLYARDLNTTPYFQYLFEDLETIYQKVIIADDCIEIVESKYNWSSFLEKNKSTKSELITILDEEDGENYSVLTPECDSLGFSIGNIDSFDLIILEILEKSKTIQELLDELKEYFDEDELNQSNADFEKLVFGRIKLGIHLKSIRVVY